MKLIMLFSLIGLILSPIAALMAFLITYKEYEHHYPGKSEPLKLATEAAIFTFVLFMIIAVIAGLFVSQFI